MAPKSPWKKTAGQGAPTNVPPSPSAAAVRTDYGQAQQEEVEVLQAIYMGEFEEVETKAAWNSSDKAFNIRLKAFSNEGFSLLLCVKLTASYPKTLPILSIKDVSPDLPSEAVDAIRALLRKKPRELLGEVMIHEIATSIQDILEDATQK